MKVKELIETLQQFDPECEVKTHADYDEYGTGTIASIMTDTWRSSDEEVVMVFFDFDGDI